MILSCPSAELIVKQLGEMQRKGKKEKRTHFFLSREMRDPSPPPLLGLLKVRNEDHRPLSLTVANPSLLEGLSVKIPARAATNTVTLYSPRFGVK